MHRPLTLLCSFALATSLLAAPHDRLEAGSSPAESTDRERVSQYIVEPEHVWSAAETAALAADGVHVQKVLAGGRYLVRTDDADALQRAELLVRSASPLTAPRKMDATALREAAKPLLHARVSLLFDDATTFEEASALIARAGGSVDRSLQYRFDPLQRIVARVPAANLRTLASDGRVIAVYGATRLEIANDNSVAAELSKVTPLFSAPYDLSGKDVMLSFFEIGAAYAAHPEFGGRLEVKFTSNSSSEGEHATHVAGTMIASGLVAGAKGMAPAARLTGYGVSDDEWLDNKAALPSIGAVADSNSWGYILGWKSEAENWVWTGNAELYGGYIYENASLDQVARDTNVLMVHSAGNDATKLGPEVAPYAHKHEDDNGDTILDKTYCYSVNGSGEDCAAPCTAGRQFCETTRHPVNAPLHSVGVLASSKNIITVGAVSDASTIASFSSRGPTNDGRIKPEIVARGVGVYSTLPGGSYGRKNGTSMATPVVTGITALLTEQWRRTFAGANPIGATLKTLLLATADDVGTAGPDYVFGFGLANAKAAVDTIRDDNATGSRIRIANATQGSQLEIPITVAASQKLRVTLGWFDPPVLLAVNEVADATLINDLDLKVIDPTGATVLPFVLDMNNPEAAATRGVNTIDNTEMVEIASATPGTYRAVVTGRRIAASSPQQFVLVTSAPAGAAAPPCTDPTEPNDSAETGYGYLSPTLPVMARLCSGTDVDYFRLRPDRPGTVSVVVTAGASPVKATLSGPTQNASIDLAAGETKTVQLANGSSTATVYVLKVESNGAQASDATYYLTPSFGKSAPVRRRAK